MTAPRRSGRPSAISSVGLTGAPSTAAPVAPVPAQPLPPFPDVPAPELAPVPQSAGPVSSRRRDVTTSRTLLPGTTPPPKAEAETTIAYTVRFDLGESMAIDAMGIRLRMETGRRKLDRSEIIRALLRLTETDDAVREALVRELTTS